MAQDSLRHFVTCGSGMAAPVRMLKQHRAVQGPATRWNLKKVQGEVHAVLPPGTCDTPGDRCK